MPPAPRLVRACRQEPLDRPPVWLMRQAGRYMAEYRAMRERYDFLALCHTPDAAVEVSLQPYRTFGMDGVIMFSDILIPPEAMGMRVVFGDGGPSFPEPIRSAEAIDRLIIPDPVEATGFVMSILRQLRTELRADSDTALIGFAGAPWTLAAYMIEGGGSKQFSHLKQLMWAQPDALHRLLDKLSQTVSLYLQAQIEAGAHVVQLFDTWGGILPEEAYRHWILPYHQQIIRAVKAAAPDTPVILYVNNSRGLLSCLAESGADVISVDHLTSISAARDQLGTRFALQGNLDPISLFAPPEILREQVQHLLHEGGTQGYIFNLGHGILPHTPVDHVRLLVDLVKASAATPAAR